MGLIHFNLFLQLEFGMNIGSTGYLLLDAMSQPNNMSKNLNFSLRNVCICVDLLSIYSDDRTFN